MIDVRIFNVRMC